jgi:hypothetical protein
MLTLDSHGKVCYKPDKKSHDELWMCCAIVIPILVAAALIILSWM